MRALIVALALAFAAATAHASTQRIAVIVGNNAGNEGKTPLHFAEIDAAKFARVLAELGGVAPSHLFVLQGKPLAALGETFALVKRQIDAFRADPPTGSSCCSTSPDIPTARRSSSAPID